MSVEQAGNAQSDGNMAVVPTGVHAPRNRGGVGHPGLFGNGQGIDIRPTIAVTKAHINMPELREKIFAAVDSLPEKHRQVVILREIEGMSYKEIAEVMACSLGTVMSRLYYARQKLQGLLKDEYESR